MPERLLGSRPLQPRLNLPSAALRPTGSPAPPALAGPRANKKTAAVESHAAVEAHATDWPNTRPRYIKPSPHQNTGCPLMMLGSQVEKNGMYVTMLIALKIAR
ncbi:hypothetical protein Bpla01_01570 [Burkholderia plantarii]|nr:hypothetical protein Bpla01_01570 [Burkholderia plantarii]